MVGMPPSKSTIPDLQVAFHDELDFVSVHEALLQEFKSALQGLRGRQSLDTQVEAIIKVKASKLSDLPSLARVSTTILPAAIEEMTSIRFSKTF